MSIATRTGDLGETGLMYGRRVSKFDNRVETYGTVDELNASIGMARSLAKPIIADELIKIQKQLVGLMGQLAVASQDAQRYKEDKKYTARLEPEMLTHLDGLVAKFEAEKISMDGWATPGKTTASAALDVARTVCRRAERLVVRLQKESGDELALAIQYLNRLSDLLWLMARYTETTSG